MLRAVARFISEVFISISGILLLLVLTFVMAGLALSAVGFIWWFVKGWFGQ